MYFRVRRRQYLPAHVNLGALPVGYNSAGGLNYSDRRLNIIGMKPGLDDQIDLPGRDQCISISIQTVAGQITVF